MVCKIKESIFAVFATHLKSLCVCHCLRFLAMSKHVRGIGLKAVWAPMSSCVLCHCPLDATIGALKIQLLLKHIL